MVWMQGVTCDESVYSVDAEYKVIPREYSHTGQDKWTCLGRRMRRRAGERALGVGNGNERRRTPRMRTEKRRQIMQNIQRA